MSPTSVENRLSEAVADVWMRAHLRPLVGLGVERAGEDDRGAEASAAWRRFLEGVAAEQPTVLVFEDLHWADDALRARTIEVPRPSLPGGGFSRVLAQSGRRFSCSRTCTGPTMLFSTSWTSSSSGRAESRCSSSVPHARSCSSRGRRGAVESRTLSRSRSHRSRTTTRRVCSLACSDALSWTRVPQEALLTRAGGNPLYAEQYAHLLEERPDGDLSLPETVQGLIAARLDMLDSFRSSSCRTLRSSVARSGSARCGGVGCRASAPRSLRCTRSSARGSYGVSARRRSPATSPTPSSTCSFATWPTRRSRALPARRSTG